MRPRVNSNASRNLKAVTSFRYDSEVKHIEGVIRGYVSTLTLESAIAADNRGGAVSQPLLTPRFICPFGKDVDFIERSVLADLLVLRGPGSRHALVGAGGIGKSQIAIEYGYRVQRDFPNTWVFWIDAENITKMEESYREIARILRINGASDKDADVFGLVYDWLRNEANATWLMIIDNADDKDVFNRLPPKYKGPDQSKEIREFIPQSSNGSVLVTSRSRDAAFQITCNYKNIKHVEPMSEAEAIALLQTHLEDSHEDEDKRLLVETVDYIPLAITHAAAYISRRSLPIRDYLQELSTKDEEDSNALEEDIPQLRRKAGRSNSIVKTWKITFEYVRKTMPSASRLLSLMCLFDRQDIPEALLQGQYSEVILSSRNIRKSWWKRRPHTRRKKIEQQSLSCPKSLPRDFEDDWLALRDFSLIKMNRDRRHFSMHPLVQFTTKRWLVQHDELDIWSQHFIRILDDRFHDSDDGDFKRCEPLIAHAYAAIPYRPSNAAIHPLRAWASLTRKIARYYDQRTGLEIAQDLYRVAAEAFGTTGGKKTPEALKCQAEAIQMQSLEVRVRNFGLAHPSTQESLTKRGYFLLAGSRYNEAYVTWKQASEARNVARDTSWVKELDLIGLRLQLDGRSADAEYYLRESLSEKERMFGEDNDSTVPEAAATLARILLSQEKYIEAEALLRRALSWYDSSEFYDNPERFQTMSDLAHTIAHTDKLEEAKELAIVCLSWRTESFGSHGRETLEIMWILAGVLEKQGSFVRALQKYRDTYEGARQTLGEAHADTKDYKRDYEKLEQAMYQKSSAISDENWDAATINSAFHLSNENTGAGAQEPGAVLFDVTESEKKGYDGTVIAAR
ncbi:hypothetical protein J4E89_003498 [Alternaria sp. Ai002NY15]|nr:hypothetical protein J4E89_003498 [Alternaria sp. Ai002NY15]